MFRTAPAVVRPIALALLLAAPLHAADRAPIGAAPVPPTSANAASETPGAAVLAVPASIPFQGFLTDAGGNPLGVPAPVNVTVDFRFYDAAGGGTLLHNEAHVVSVSEGVFQAALSPPANLFHDTPRFLGLAVDGGAELAPRTEVLSAPFALVSGTLSGFGSVDAQVTDSRGLTAIVAGTTDQNVRRFYLEATGGSSWTGRDGRLVISANGPGGGDGTITVRRQGITIATLDVPAGGSRPWTWIVDVPSLLTGEAIDVVARADVATAPLLVCPVTLETAASGAGADADWTVVGNNMNSAVTGNVGIGVAAAATDAKLDVESGTGKGVEIRNSGTGNNVALFAQNAAGVSARFHSASNFFTGSLATPTALVVSAGGSDWGSFFFAEDNTAVVAHVGGSGTALVARDVGGFGKAAEFQGDVDMLNDLTVNRVVRTDSLNAPSGTFAVTGNLASTSGDFYAASLNGVINCGGGAMNVNANVIADTTPTISFALGDEDLFIEDDLEVLGQGYKPGGGSWATVSDARLKTDVRDFEDGLEAVLKLNPVWYRYSEASPFADEREYVGVVAQDVREVAPYMVEEKALQQIVREDEQGNEIILDPGERYLTYDPSALVYLLVNAVQQQQAMIEEQRGRIEALERSLGGR